MSQPPPVSSTGGTNNNDAVRAVLARHPYILPPTSTPANAPVPTPVPVQTTALQQVAPVAPVVAANNPEVQENSVPPSTTTTTTTTTAATSDGGYAPLNTTHPCPLVSGAEAHNPPPVDPTATGQGRDTCSTASSIQKRVGDTIRTVFQPLESPLQRVVRAVEVPVRGLEHGFKAGLERMHDPVTRGLDQLSYHLHRAEEPISRFAERAEPHLAHIIRPAERMVRQGEHLAHRVVDPIERRFRQATGELSHFLVGPPPPPGVYGPSGGHHVVVQQARVPVEQQQQQQQQQQALLDPRAAHTDGGKAVEAPDPAHSAGSAQPHTTPATVVPQVAPVVNSQGQVVQDSNTCSVCMAREKNALFIPCRHVACCMEDAHRVKECPLCRGEVTGVLGPIFI